MTCKAINVRRPGCSLKFLLEDLGGIASYH